MATLAKITITNTEKAKTAAENLAAAAVELDSVRVSIQNILQELGQYWSKSQQDAQAFASVLEAHAKFLETFAVNSKDLASIVTNYVELQETTSSNVVN